MAGCHVHVAGLIRSNSSQGYVFQKNSFTIARCGIPVQEDPVNSLQVDKLAVGEHDGDVTDLLVGH